MKVFKQTDASVREGNVRARDWPSYRHLGGAGLSSLYYAGRVSETALTTYTYTAATTASLFAFPMIGPARGAVVDLMQVNVTTAGANSLGRIGIYNNLVESPLDNGSVLYPGSLVTGSDQIAFSSTGVKSVSVNRFETSPGSLFWLTIVVGAGALPIVRSQSPVCLSTILGYDNTFGVNPTLGFSQAHPIANPLPATFSSTVTRVTVATMATVPALAVRFST